MYREVTMIEFREVLRLWQEQVPKKRIAARLGLDPKTVRRYLWVRAQRETLSDDQLSPWGRPPPGCRASSTSRTCSGVRAGAEYAFYNGNGFPQYGTTSNGAMFFYGIPGGTQGIPPQPAIHWGPSEVCWLKNYTVPGSCKK